MQRIHKLVHGFSSYGEKDVPDSEMTAAGHYGLQHGVKEIDVAPHYRKGKQEHLLGSMKSTLHEKQAEQLKISTKVGIVIEEKDEKEDRGFKRSDKKSRRFDYTVTGIETSFEQSKHRLDVSKVHAIYVHDLDKDTHGDNYEEMQDDFFKRGGYAALQNLKTTGKTDKIGLGSNDASTCLELIKRDDFKIDRILLAGSFDLIHTDLLKTEFFKICRDKKIEIYLAAPFCSGILAGTKIYKYGEANDAVLKKVAAIQAVCDEHHVKLAHAAVQFVCLHPQVKGVAVGLRTVKEMRDSLYYAKTPIEQKFWLALKEKGLIPQNAPTDPIVLCSTSINHFKPQLQTGMQDKSKVLITEAPSRSRL